MTTHAIRRYAKHVYGWAGEDGHQLPGHLRRRALTALIRQSEEARFVEARPATDKLGAAELWRGPAPMRLRFVVGPPRGPGRLPSLRTVMPSAEDRPEILFR
jgi:hypothetical protein